MALKRTTVYTENFEAEIAADFVNLTNTPVFLTGKAGTGKTTFLRSITKNTTKKCVVVAPTGVAAINAGGTTIHSMFGLPTKSFIPSNDFIDPNLANNMSMITRHFHYNRQKLDVIQELELLIIDEVSMVRADILDAVDYALRYTRRDQRPFGGVQVLFIGDMYQLPPVVKDDEWPMLSKYYSGPFFFNSKSFEKLDPVYIELKKIYRQSDRNFINILNNIRHQEFEQEDYDALKELYNSEFQPDEPGYITLTTHNKKADAINEMELAKLGGDELTFDAAVSGDFGDTMFPTERLLRLKVGAQVMFVKNDTSGEKKYYNGRIGIVEKIDQYPIEEDEVLQVRFPDTGEKIWVQKELWENVRYSLNTEDNKLEQNRIGSFEQYPLRLAWAITIHKSQGLTFDKAVIDAGESFSPGQVYVALSRCTSMDHLVLKSIITNRNIFSDPRVVDFSSRIMKDYVLENRLEEGEKQYAFEQLIKLFDFQSLRLAVQKWDKAVSKIKTVSRAESFRRTSATLKNIDDLHDVALKFHAQITGIFGSDEPLQHRMEQLRDRCNSAIAYFAGNLYKQIIGEWESHLEEIRFKKQMKKYVQECAMLLNVFWYKLGQLQNCEFGGEKVYSGVMFEKPEQKSVAVKKVKSSTFQDTLELFRSGKSIAEIAEIRDMTVGTIEKHMEKHIASGLVELGELLSEEKESLIRSVMDHSSITQGEIKSRLGDAVSWSEIRWLMAARSKKATAKV